MIYKYQKFQVENLKIEANYNAESMPCEIIRFTIDGKEAYINRHDLYALLILYANSDEITEMVRVSEKKVKMIRKAVKVTANKDLKKGEDVTFIIEFPVDEDIADQWYEKNKDVISMDEAKKMLIK